ncbi:MAG: hypothetical protein NC341_09950 [Blautia sp.]|nr:hypothetical protein [Blautia sp.]
MSRDIEAGRRNFFFQYLLLFVVLIFCFYQFSAHRLYGFSVYPDEFGYWANAAQRLGYDWSDVASLGYYYSFGYSLILAPILRFCHDNVQAYRAAAFVNMSLQCLSACLLWGIFRRLYCPADCGAEGARIRGKQIVFAVGVSAFYPAWTFYTQTTLAETLIAFLYVFVCYQFLLLLEERKTVHVILRILLLLIAFLYLHFVHMRTVGVVVFAAFVMAFYLWHRPQYRKLLLMAGVTLLIGAAIGIWFKDAVTKTVYASADAGKLAVTDYAGKLQLLKEILTLRGMKTLLQSFAGKLYYLGMASFGLFYPAVFFCIGRTGALLYGIFHKDAAEGKKTADWFCLFLLLSMIGQLVVTAVYTRETWRLDSIIYGRYNEYLLPVFMGIGILELVKCRHPWKAFGCGAGISTALFIVTLWTALHSGAAVMRGVFATGLSYLSENAYPYQILPEFLKAYLFGLLLMALVYGSVWLGGRLKQTACVTAFVILIELLLTICLCRKYTWAYNDSDYYDLKVCEYIEEYEAGNGNIDASVSYLYGGGTYFIDLLQFAMRDKRIEILAEKEESGEEKAWDVLEPLLPEDGFLIADYNSPYLVELEECYEKCVESNSFVLFKGAER